MEEVDFWGYTFEAYAWFKGVFLFANFFMSCPMLPTCKGGTAPASSFHHDFLPHCGVNDCKTKGSGFTRKHQELSQGESLSL